MKKGFLFFSFLVSGIIAFAQKAGSITNTDQYIQLGKYLSFNPLGLLEPQIAAGLGGGIRMSDRSEFFTELSYVAKHPAYQYDNLNFYHGIRLLAQYRYHFLQQWRPLINFGAITKFQRERRRRNQSFIAVEFRYKPASFSSYNAFENKATADTLNKYAYKAISHSIGGAILFGETFSLNKEDNLFLEITAGIGAKQKFVKYTNVPQGYSVIPKIPREMNFIPKIDEAVGMPYFPCTIRLRYLLR